MQTNHASGPTDGDATGWPRSDEPSCTGERLPCRNELVSVLECLEIPAILIDRDHRILAFNESYHSLFGGAKTLHGRKCYEVSHKIDQPCDCVGETCPLRSCAATGRPCRALHVHHTAHGVEHQDVTAYPIRSADGELQAFLEITHPCRVASAQPDRQALVGSAPSFNRALELVRRVAPSDTTVLLEGESGTGKELVARAIHRMSGRAEGPFVPVDCSGLSETLFESELFGHERGAFTGAVVRKRGLVEAARGGTILLDELGDIPLNLQVKLLRLIESRMFRRVGCADHVKADFRLICATHRDLRKLVEDGLFRQDLYFRISPYPVRIPPLRERIEDVPLLVESLLARLSNGRRPRVSNEALEAMCRYHFPGNVRELLNIIERAVLLADGGVIKGEHLSDDVLAGAVIEGHGGPLGQDIVPLAEMECRYLRWAMTRYEGDKASLARALGLGERTFYRKLKRARQPTRAQASSHEFGTSPSCSEASAH